jgi:hypothetical protein
MSAFRLLPISPVLLPSEQRIGGEHHGSPEAGGFAAAPKQEISAGEDHSGLRIGSRQKASEEHLIERVAAAQDNELNIVRFKQISNTEQRRLFRKRRLFAAEIPNRIPLPAAGFCQVHRQAKSCAAQRGAPSGRLLFVGGSERSYVARIVEIQRAMKFRVHLLGGLIAVGKPWARTLVLRQSTGNDPVRCFGFRDDREPAGVITKSSQVLAVSIDHHVIVFLEAVKPEGRVLHELGEPIDSGF